MQALIRNSLYLTGLLCGFLLAGCAVPKHTGGEASWRLIYQNDSTGHTLYGNKQALIKAIKRGSPIRMAWGEKLDDGTSDVEFAVPEFTTLVNDTDVVVQFAPSMIQTEYMNAKKSYLKTNPPTQWRALMSTDGHYHQFHNDMKTGEVTRIMFLKTAMAWYAFVPENDNRFIPLLTIKNGIQLDSIKRK